MRKVWKIKETTENFLKFFSLLFHPIFFFSHLVGNTAERKFPEQFVGGSRSGLAGWRGRAFQVYWVAQCVLACADTLGWSTVVADGSFLLVF